MGEVIMPKMGDAMTEGKVLRWMKRPGDQVTEGEAIAEIETDKVNVELPAEESGTLVRVLAEEGQAVPVGQAIAVIGRAGETAPPAEASTAPSGRPETQPIAPAAGPVPTPAPDRERPMRVPERVPPEERIKASPVARRLAAQHGVDLAAIPGTGPGGRITEADVEEYARAHAAQPAATGPAAPVPTGAPAAGRTAEAQRAAGAPGPLAAGDVPLARMRQTIARRMTESKQQVPHFYVTVEVRMDEAASIRRQLNEGLGEKVVSLNDLVMRAAALALRTFPNLNASFAGDTVRRHAEINVGMALALPEGLLVPVIRHCDRKSVVEIAREVRDIGDRARRGRLRPEELQGGTFTVSNLGMFGDVESFVAIINPPQAAILAVGKAMERPVADAGAVRVATTMKATLSADHRVTDGAEVALYLAELKRLLERPALLLVNL